jgi:hypothetical protein
MADDVLLVSLEREFQEEVLHWITKNAGIDALFGNLPRPSPHLDLTP